jgi:hypothetical protein
MSNMNNFEAKKRVVVTEAKKGLTIMDLMLVAVLLGAGAVLKSTVGTLLGAGGMKPNFIIAMYCVAILLIRPRLFEAAIIGLLAGAVCQFFPGTPVINLFSEAVGAVAMCLLIAVPIGKNHVKLMDFFKTSAAAFLSTLVSGFSFLVLMWAIHYAGFTDTQPTALAIFLGIIFGTALTNAVIVQALYLPLKKVLKK